MNKARFSCLIVLIIFLALLYVKSWADSVIVLQDGEVYKGRVIEQKDKRVILRGDGGDYYLPVKSIQTVNGKSFDPNLNYTKIEQEAINVAAPEQKNIDSDKTIDIGQLDAILAHMGYPQNKRPAIEKDLLVLLNKIDFLQLKKESIQTKTNPLKLKKFIEKLGNLLDADGYLDIHSEFPLTKQLTTSFVDDNIPQVILTSPILFSEKVELIKSLTACTAASQLGSIILKMLGIDVKIAYSPEHVFDCVPLSNKNVLFVDFANLIFEIVDMDQYYQNLGSRSELLKDNTILLLKN